MKAVLKKQRQKLLELSYAYWKPRVLQAAVKAGIFTLVENWKSLEPLTPRALAVRLGWEPRATEIFLNALAGCGFLEKKGTQFRNSLQAREFLLPGKKYYVGNILNLSDAGWSDWGNLEESVRSGKSLRKPDFFTQNSEQVRNFILAMKNSALGHAEHLARKISLKKRRRFLDLGAGPGTFSIAFLKKNRKLHVTFYDLPLVLETTRECVEAEGLSRRVGYHGGNFLKDPLPDRFDAVFVSHILHGLPESQCLDLLKKIKEILEPGGLLILQDFFLDESEAAPEFASLFSLNMLLHTEGGRSYGAEEAERWLAQAGYKKVRRPKLGLPRDISILTAEKKK